MLDLVKNKAGYTASPVACGWAGAVIERVTKAFGQCSKLKKLKNTIKVKRGPTDKPTDQPTNGWTKQGVVA